MEVTILKLETRHGWTYDGCARCGSKQVIEGNVLFCPGCKRRPYRVEPKYTIMCYMIRLIMLVYYFSDL